MSLARADKWISRVLGASISLLALSAQAQPAKSASETISTIAGFDEQDKSISNISSYVFSKSALNSHDDYQSVKEEWDSYVARRGDLDQQINSCRVSRNCEPRFMAWVDLIDALKNVDDKLLVLRTVNGWVNTMLAYDTPRWKYLSAHKTDDPWKTPSEFILSGRGLCREQAILKYETLRRLGFSIKDMRLVGVMARDIDDPQQDAGHMVLAVNVEGRNWILNNQQFGGLGGYIPDPEAKNTILGIAGDNKISFEALKGEFLKNAEIETDQSAFSMSLIGALERKKLYPLYSINDESFKTYYSISETDHHKTYKLLSDRPQNDIRDYARVLTAVGYVRPQDSDAQKRQEAQQALQQIENHSFCEDENQAYDGLEKIDFQRAQEKIPLKQAWEIDQSIKTAIKLNPHNLGDAPDDEPQAPSRTRVRHGLDGKPCPG